jgi:hypothetical protein
LFYYEAAAKGVIVIVAPAEMLAAAAAVLWVLIVPATPVKPATLKPVELSEPEVVVVNETVFVAVPVTVQVPFRAVSGATRLATVILVPTGYLAPAPEDVMVAAEPVRETAVIVDAALVAAVATVTVPKPASLRSSVAAAVVKPITLGTVM